MLERAEVEIFGTCDDRFVPVRDAFEANFASQVELGASVAVTVGGQSVVDLWAGAANPAGDPWVEDTIVNVYSTTKTMAGLCVLMCADRGLVDFDAPVAEYWPEFAANGKEGVLVRHVMSHSAGLSGFDPPMQAEDLYDWDRIVSQLAGQAPWWEPGTASGYHSVTQGYLQGEIVRRVTGRSIGTFFRQEVAEPLDADFHIGLDARHDSRVGEMVPPSVVARDGEEFIKTLTDGGVTDPLAVRTHFSCPLDATEPRTRAWRGAEIPAAGGTGNARSVARIHSVLACGGTLDGVTLVSPATLDRALEPSVSGVDKVLGVPMTLGMGFGLSSEFMPLPNDRTMFWGGWGGSLALIDLENQTSIAYVMNKMADSLVGDTRGASLAAATYASLLTG
jgi:CubicO group peptidase (beta-lactamase class C family)